MITYFISDIHLHSQSDLQLNLLLDFLYTKANDADAIYILGDLFAIWFGDDLDEEYTQKLIVALNTLANNNVSIYFMRGNRDFLVGNKFCKAAACKLLPDTYLIDLYGQHVLLTHGDLLCTADKNYQKFRKIVHNKFLQYVFLNLPRSWRKMLGAWVKSRINSMPKARDLAIYDVEESTVNAWFNKYNVNCMIHGHTHKPAIHTYGNNKRIVLGDWNANNAKILACTPQEQQLINLLSS